MQLRFMHASAIEQSFGALSTLCSAVLGIFIMGDKVNASIIIGGLLILVGVRQVTRSSKKEK